MSEPAVTPATTAASTLYFGPWYRRSPFFEKTLEAGCSAYDIYNHMYLPGYYADPIEEYWALLNDVTVWDVAVANFDPHVPRLTPADFDFEIVIARTAVVPAL